MTVSWDIAPCSLVEMYRVFRAAYSCHHQRGGGSKISETTRLHDAVFQKIVIIMFATMTAINLLCDRVDDFFLIYLTPLFQLPMLRSVE
jgi:hypothetical protein